MIEQCHRGQPKHPGKMGQEEPARHVGLVPVQMKHRGAWTDSKEKPAALQEKSGQLKIKHIHTCKGLISPLELWRDTFIAFHDIMSSVSRHPRQSLALNTVYSSHTVLRS